MASLNVGNFDNISISQDPKSLQLLAGLVEAAMKSPLRGKMWINAMDYNVDDIGGGKNEDVAYDCSDDK